MYFNFILYSSTEKKHVPRGHTRPPWHRTGARPTIWEGLFYGQLNHEYLKDTGPIMARVKKIQHFSVRASYQKSNMEMAVWWCVDGMLLIQDQEPGKPGLDGCGVWVYGPFEFQIASCQHGAILCLCLSVCINVSISVFRVFSFCVLTGWLIWVRTHVWSNLVWCVPVLLR